MATSVTRPPEMSAASEADHPLEIGGSGGPNGWNPTHQNGDDLGMVYDAGFTTLCHANKEKSLSPLHQMSQRLKFLNRSRLRERERDRQNQRDYRFFLW